MVWLVLLRAPASVVLLIILAGCSVIWRWWQPTAVAVCLISESAISPSVHQPSHGAERTSAAATAPEPTRRIIRTRSLASTTRLRSSSVGHSHDWLVMLTPRPVVR
jgi:hypothetical protein